MCGLSFTDVYVLGRRGLSVSLPQWKQRGRATSADTLGLGIGSSDGTDISEPSRRNGGGFGMVRGNGVGFGIEGVGAGCTALRGSCSAFTCGRGCVAVEALWPNASLDDEERVLETMRVPLFFEFVHLPSFMPHTFSSLQ